MEKNYTTRLLYILAFGAGCLIAFFASCHRDKKSDGESVPSVSVAEVTTDSVVLHKTYPGYIYAANSAEVVGEVNGRLLSKQFKSGSYVTKGQVLFTIETTQYTDAVEQARSALAQAESNVAYYSRQTEALTKALASDAVSQMEVLQARNNLTSARASVQNAQASLRTASDRLSKCVVRAPISGYISDAEMSVGNYINGEGSPVLMARIYDNSSFNCEFSIEDSQYEKMTSDGTVHNNLLRAIPLQFRDPLPHKYTADLSYQSPSVSTSTGTLTLKGTVNNIDNELKDGMYVTVSLPYGVDPKAVIVKDAALGTDQLGKYLYVVNDSDKVVYTPVTVGEVYQDSLRIIEKGVKPGQRYVTKALLTVRNGMKVKPVK